MKELMKALETKRMLSIVYHPQTDSQTERINQEIETFLQYYVNYRQDDWAEWITAAEFQYNDKKYVATEQIPFVLTFGRHPWKGNLKVYMEIPRLEELLTELQKSWEEAIKLMEAVQEVMKKQFNRKRKKPQGLKVGDIMWLEAKNIHSNRPSKKLDQKRYRL